MLITVEKNLQSPQKKTNLNKSTLAKGILFSLEIGIIYFSGMGNANTNTSSTIGRSRLHDLCCWGDTWETIKQINSNLYNPIFFFH